MSKRKATEINLSENQKRIITELARSTHQPLNLKIRAQIIDMASEGSNNSEILREMSIDAKQVRRWRDRYFKNQEQLSIVEREVPHKLRSAIIETLSDEPRTGAPARIQDEQVAAIIAMACEEPEKFDLPVSHWTPSLLRQKAVEIGIVDEISVRQVGRFLKGERLAAASKPMLVKPKHRKL
jgi:transposase